MYTSDAQNCYLCAANSAYLEALQHISNYLSKTQKSLLECLALFPLSKHNRHALMYPPRPYVFAHSLLNYVLKNATLSQEFGRN